MQSCFNKCKKIMSSDKNNRTLLGSLGRYIVEFTESLLLFCDMHVECPLLQIKVSSKSFTCIQVAWNEYP